MIKMIIKDIAQYEEGDSQLARHTIMELQEENNRLNNIINELEKNIEYEIDESKFEDDYERADNLDWCLQTIKLLKGEDKE